MVDQNLQDFLDSLTFRPMAMRVQNVHQTNQSETDFFLGPFVQLVQPLAMCIFGVTRKYLEKAKNLLFFTILNKFLESKKL